VTLRVMGPQFGETVYSSEVNGARKVKSIAQVSMNKNSDPVQNFFLRGWLGRTVPQNRIFPNIWNCRARKHILGLQVNIDKAKSFRYHITR